MKRVIAFLFAAVLLLSLCSCAGGQQSEEEVYEQILLLLDGYTVSSASYTTVLTNETRNLTLTNQGELTEENGVYTYTYSYQYLNSVGSGADSLISTVTGTVTGTREEILSEGISVTDSVKVVSLNLKDSLKTHSIRLEGDSYVMNGYIARNTMIQNTDHLDTDIRFNYELTVNSELTAIERLVISYVTTQFDSVVITLSFGGKEQTT